MSLHHSRKIDSASLQCHVNNKEETPSSWARFKDKIKNCSSLPTTLGATTFLGGAGLVVAGSLGSAGIITLATPISIGLAAVGGVVAVGAAGYFIVRALRSYCSSRQENKQRDIPQKSPSRSSSIKFDNKRTKIGTGTKTINERNFPNASPLAIKYCNKYDIGSEHVMSIHNCINKMYTDGMSMKEFSNLPPPDQIYLHRTAAVSSVQFDSGENSYIQHHCDPSAHVYDNLSPNAKDWGEKHVSKLSSGGGINFLSSTRLHLDNPYKDLDRGESKEKVLDLVVTLETALQSNAKIYGDTHASLVGGDAIVVSLPSADARLPVIIRTESQSQESIA